MLLPILKPITDTQSLKTRSKSFRAYIVDLQEFPKIVLNPEFWLYVLVKNMLGRMSNGSLLICYNNRAFPNECNTT